MEIYNEINVVFNTKFIPQPIDQEVILTFKFYY